MRHVSRQENPPGPQRCDPGVDLRRGDDGGRLRLSEADLYLLIEKALLENEAYDVAKSLAFRRSMEKTGAVDVHTGPHALPVRLIRRNHQVVPWNSAKIEIAIRKAFLSLQKDPAPATAITRAPSGPVTETVAPAAISPGTESAAGEPLHRFPVSVARPCTCVDPTRRIPSTTPGQSRHSAACAPSSTPDTAARLALAAEQLQALVAMRGDQGLLIARKHLNWTCQGFAGASIFLRSEANR